MGTMLLLAALAALAYSASSHGKASAESDSKVTKRPAPKKPVTVRAPTPKSEAEYMAMAAQLAEREEREREASKPQRVRVAPVKSMPSASAASLAWAREHAQGVADYVRAHRKNYDRAVVARWQRAAGRLNVDGIYGPKTRARLAALGAKGVP